MLEIVLKYVEYNVWANKLIIDLLNTLTTEESERALTGSFPSVRNTVAHIKMAENIWLQRLQMSEKVVVSADDPSMSFADLCLEWMNDSNSLLTFTQRIFDDRGLHHEFHYQNIKGEHFKSTVWECLYHVCNHSTFHRGQLIIYLRQLGKTKIPSTDFITFCRKGK